MKYFTKYLPVEGRDYEGLCLTPDGIKTIKNDRGMYISTPENHYYELYMLQTVELFLCSRDIQLGDAVYYDVMDFPEYPLVIDTESRMREVSTFNPYKAIGEISPDHLHIVTDEFDGIHHIGTTGEFVQMLNGGYCIPLKS